jgi:hypothetical protein
MHLVRIKIITTDGVYTDLYVRLELIQFICGSVIGVKHGPDGPFEKFELEEPVSTVLERLNRAGVKLN